MTTIAAPSGEPCRHCVSPAELLVYDALAGVAIWVCGKHVADFDVLIYDRGTIPALDGVKPS